MSIKHYQQMIETTENAVMHFGTALLEQELKQILRKNKINILLDRWNNTKDRIDRLYIELEIAHANSIINLWNIDVEGLRKELEYYEKKNIEYKKQLEEELKRIIPEEEL